MRFLSEQKALINLQVIKSDLKSEISDNYEPRAKSCMTCETQGSCCLDAHFVNVHISRLEAVAIQRSLSKLPSAHQREIKIRVESAIKKYSLAAHGDTFAQTFACPLFEKGTGCLVHSEAKPVACIVHACYESVSDLPPDALQERAEARIDLLNERAYGRVLPVLPLPLALRS